MGLKGLREGRWEGRDTARRNPGVVPTEIRDLRAFKMPKIKGSDSVKRRATWVLLMPILAESLQGQKLQVSTSTSY